MIETGSEPREGERSTSFRGLVGKGGTCPSEVWEYAVKMCSEALKSGAQCSSATVK